MRAELLYVEGFDFININDYKSIIIPNQHGTVFIKGNIRKESRQDYLEKVGKLVKVSAKTDENTIKLMFFGIIKGCDIQSNGDVHELSLDIVSQSITMEKKEHFRTFQKTSMSYNEILELIVKEYDKGAFINAAKKQGMVNGFSCQYRENDWEYIKRLAGNNEDVIYPDYMTEGVRFFMGVPNGRDVGEIKSEYYEFGTVEKEYLGIPLEDVTYKLVLRDIYDIGDNAIFNREKLKVISRKSRFEHNEIIHEYLLAREGSLRGVPYDNERLSGAAVFGKVTGVENELVSVALDDDENDNGGQSLLSYATIYSSPDGGGWYCMPEIGDRVMVKFPDSKDSNAYVQNAIHVGAGNGRDNPKVKFFKNKEGKEIRLSPESIIITNNNGTSIELIDDDGVYIKSRGVLSIDANLEVDIESKSSSIKVISKDSIQLNQNGTQMEISDRAITRGSKVYLT
jgi:hypothetical protein